VQIESMNARDFLVAICAKCPSYETPVPDCPLRDYRRVGTPPGEALAKLSNGEAEELVRAHFLCVCRKEGCGA
jgi:hypothetical protein